MEEQLFKNDEVGKGVDAEADKLRAADMVEKVNALEGRMKKAESSAEEDVLGTESEHDKRRKMAAEDETRREQHRKKVARKRKEEEDEKLRLSKIEYDTVLQYHPCTWCDGKRVQKKYPKGTKAPESVVIGLEIPVPAIQVGVKPPLIVCQTCLARVFNNILGQARNYGVEMQNLTGKPENSGFFPPSLRG